MSSSTQRIHKVSAFMQATKALRWYAVTKTMLKDSTLSNSGELLLQHLHQMVTQILTDKCKLIKYIVCNSS